jgi:2-polyprenyl-3-methyl-5-hydroxy-6-metoxy-1,4-benzoquinol methylase
MADLVTLATCPACGSDRARRFAVGDTEMRRCRGCALVYAPNVADPSTIYDDRYLTGDSEYGPDTTDPIVAAIGCMAAARRFEIIERMTPVGTVLDVGCGSGEALMIAEQRGWSGIGVELVEASAARARDRGLDIRTSTLQRAGLPPASFDVVVAAHVLEHMLEPVAFVEEVARYARPGGLVVLEVPNWSHRLRRVKWADWEQLCPFEHVTHFSPRTLRRTIKRAGLTPRIRTETVVSRTPFVDRMGFGFAIVASATV